MYNVHESLIGLSFSSLKPREQSAMGIAYQIRHKSYNAEISIAPEKLQHQIQKVSQFYRDTAFHLIFTQPYWSKEDFTSF